MFWAFFLDDPVGGGGGGRAALLLHCVRQRWPADERMMGAGCDRLGAAMGSLIGD